MQHSTENHIDIWGQEILQNDRKIKGTSDRRGNSTSALKQALLCVIVPASLSNEAAGLHLQNRPTSLRALLPALQLLMFPLSSTKSPSLG
jgi:hypothetical protein